MFSLAGMSLKAPHSSSVSSLMSRWLRGEHEVSRQRLSLSLMPLVGFRLSHAQHSWRQQSDRATVSARGHRLLFNNSTYPPMVKYMWESLRMCLHGRVKSVNSCRNPAMASFRINGPLQAANRLYKQWLWRAVQPLDVDCGAGCHSRYHSAYRCPRAWKPKYLIACFIT